MEAERPWVGRLARVGMLAPGLLYVLVGWLALTIAFGNQQGNPSRKGALHALAGQTWGMAALAGVAAGFAGYALWRFVVAALGEKLSRTTTSTCGSGSGTSRGASCTPRSAGRPCRC